MLDTRHMIVPGGDIFTCVSGANLNHTNHCVTCSYYHHPVVGSNATKAEQELLECRCCKGVQQTDYAYCFCCVSKGSTSYIHASRDLDADLFGTGVGASVRERERATQRRQNTTLTLVRTRVGGSARSLNHSRTPAVYTWWYEYTRRRAGREHAGGEMMRVGGPAGAYEGGFTHTWKSVDRLKVEDELEQVKPERASFPVPTITDE